MKKKRWIILIIIVIVGAGVACFLFYKQPGESEYQNQTSESDCQNFIKECCNKQWSLEHEVYPTQDGRTNMDDKCDEACPNDCSRYTEERGYFKDKKEQEKYYKKAVKECKKKYERCKPIEKGFASCVECDKYGQPKHLGVIYIGN